ncbi:MAG: hypothetical protein D6776_05495, partial [Planctomycetota bacterium]
HRHALAACLVLSALCVGAHATPLTFGNPDWEIALTDAGYSDFLLYGGDFPSPFLHELISGEHAAAIGYGRNGVALAPKWLERDFLYPDWTTNSDFAVVEPIQFGAPGAGTLDPFDPLADPDGDGLVEGFSVIANADVEILITYDFIDTVTGTPMGIGSGSVSSNRYVLDQSYRVKNLSPVDSLTDVRFYQMLHGHPANTEWPGVTAVHDTAVYGPAPLDAFHYDITETAENTGALDGTPTGWKFRDYIGIAAASAPDAYGLGVYPGHGPGKPISDVLTAIEGDGGTPGDLTGNGTLFGPEEVAGFLRWDVPSLAPGAAVTFDIVLSVQSQTLERPRVPEPSLAGLALAALLTGLVVHYRG